MYAPVDGFSQYSIYLDYFKDMLSGNTSLFYSLSKSLGGDMYGLFTYYLASPYNIIVMLFKKANITVAFDIILMLKIASAGFTFYFLLNRRKEPKLSRLIFSCMYAMSSASIIYGINVMWLDSLILLPLLIAGLEDLIKLKKPIFYTIILSLILITNYYMGFIVCIFVTLYFLYRLILELPKSKKEILEIFLKFVIFSIIGVLIAAVVILPAFIGIKEGRADFSFSSLGFGKNFKLKDLIPNFFTNSFSIKCIGNDGPPPIFCGIFANFLCLIYFMNSKIRKKEKILSFLFLAIFFASFYIKGINLLWVLGNIPAFYIYRYAFCFSFMYIIIANKSFENIKEGTKTWHIILAIFIYEIIGIFMLEYDLNVADPIWTRIDMILVVILGGLIELSKLELKKVTNKVRKVF